MKLADFDYNLPKELIAQYPLKERESARLLVLERKSGKIEHRIFKDILDYIKPPDLLVLNDSKVSPCRLFGRRPSGGKVEVMLLKKKEGLTFEAMISPGRVKLNEEVIFNNGGLLARLTARDELTFEARSVEDIYAHGVMPLPPYIKRKSGELDNTYYQTVYAQHDGSVASPTAGLHFTPQLLEKLKSSGVGLAYVTLHVGLGTFKPVKVEDITRHKMEKEYFSISDKASLLIDRARSKRERIIATGTTSCRVLEAYASGIREGETDLFIYPGYKFKMVDSLLTNFHLPKSTLYMLTLAFAGEALIKKAYQEAIDNKYRFYSYGDCMLIL
ncbi:MAG: tRNA preQ1(34) S-adenosylmethionine ribosyltransferase-isomerase QueA [Candidatus Omnitrophica bacterium]|nr:tRNA preQ1(34) S-adenosylmethionine ribosyltransferase-isomerase QueA [Candidatus Omnitrophota bacterium]